MSPRISQKAGIACLRLKNGAVQVKMEMMFPEPHMNTLSTLSSVKCYIDKGVDEQC
jgi:hypothetical protein